jgi:hypothetical protein
MKPAIFLNSSRVTCYFLLALILFFTLTSYGQNTQEIGANSNAIAYATVAIPKATFSSNNINCLAYETNGYAQFNYKQHFFIQDLNTAHAMIAMPIKKLVYGLHAKRFGPSHYQESQIGLSIAHRIEHTALALKINYEQIAVENFNTTSTYSIEIGGITKLNEHLYWGSELYNFTFSEFKERQLPVVLRTGFSYVQPRITIALEVEKNSFYPLLLKAGLHYELHTHFKINLGIQPTQNSIHSGFNLNIQQWNLDYAIQWLTKIGVCQEICLRYELH